MRKGEPYGDFLHALMPISGILLLSARLGVFKLNYGFDVREASPCPKRYAPFCFGQKKRKGSTLNAQRRTQWS
jgi:hypothetical protein